MTYLNISIVVWNIIIICMHLYVTSLHTNRQNKKSREVNPGTECPSCEKYFPESWTQNKLRPYVSPKGFKDLSGEPKRKASRKALPGCGWRSTLPSEGESSSPQEVAKSISPDVPLGGREGLMGRGDCHLLSVPGQPSKGLLLFPAQLTSFQLITDFPFRKSSYWSSLQEMISSYCF